MDMNRMELDIAFLTRLLSKGWYLAAEGYKDSNPSYRQKQQWKILYHILLDPFFASRWFRILEDQKHHAIFHCRPRLYIKPFRTYISTQWCKNEKLKVIFDTYRFMDAYPEAFSDLLASGKSKPLARITMPGDKELRLILGYEDQFRKEGEIVLSLDCEALGGRIVSTAFSFEEISEGSWACRVGCVQGHKLKAGGLTKSAQKLMYGLKPVSFIVFALQELCQSLNCSNILAVGDSIHTYRKKHAIHLPWAHSISFDYDAFWEEAGGEQEKDGWFRLPETYKRKPVSEIKSKKRSQYRKRYAMLDEFSAQIRNENTAYSEERYA